MALDTLNRKLAVCAMVFAVFGVIMGIVSMSTNYWTVMNGEAMKTSPQWNGLFYHCMGPQPNCVFRHWPTTMSTFILCLIGLVFLMCGAIACGVMGFMNYPRQRHFIAPFAIFMACIFITAGVMDYASVSYLNSHSSRLMIATMVFSYCALPIAAFVAGRYSILIRSTQTTGGSFNKQYQQTSGGVN
jgi:hypothetical protein